MKILYCHDNMYLKSADGSIHSEGQFPYSYYDPFLQAFDNLICVSRGRDLSEYEQKETLNLSSGPNVSFSLFPNINTPIGRLKHYRQTSLDIEKLVKDCDGVIIRAVSDLGWIAFKHAKTYGKPVALEMAACAWDATWNHGNKLGKIYAPIRYRRDQKIARNADFVLYVSQEFLQKRFPTSGKTVVASNVRLQNIENGVLEKRLQKIEKINAPEGFITIGLIGNISNKIKGIEDAIKALYKLKEKTSKRFIFRQLGPGDPNAYSDLIKNLGLETMIHFDGILKTGPDVLHWLDQIDLYIQPSYQEGVPRSMIEALSRACPSLGSKAGGIPELLSDALTHKPGDTDTLAQLMADMIDNPEYQKQNAQDNIRKAEDFIEDQLMPRRIQFWKDFAAFCARKT